ncbi:hypothetical protein F4677DRAFT_430225 [Hypoxylon crocopeplum]|nr:hypothetical protein F4677DRAFT_430225 [Hypoxylon crocopeplum]
MSMREGHASLVLPPVFLRFVGICVASQDLDVVRYVIRMDQTCRREAVASGCDKIGSYKFCRQGTSSVIGRG